jgi:hypothetical protein
LILLAGDCTGSAYVFAPSLRQERVECSNNVNGDECMTNEDLSIPSYELAFEVECGATVIELLLSLLLLLLLLQFNYFREFNQFVHCTYSNRYFISVHSVIGGLYRSNTWWGRRRDEYFCSKLRVWQSA